MGQHRFGVRRVQQAQARRAAEVLGPQGVGTPAAEGTAGAHAGGAAARGAGVPRERRAGRFWKLVTLECRTKTMTAIIYAVRNKINNYQYVGHAVDFQLRVQRHLYSLRRNRNTPLLQEAWNKHGEENFEFIILEICQLEERFIREQNWMDKLKPEYNVRKKVAVTNILGKRWKASEEAVSHMVEAMQVHYDSPEYGAKIGESLRHQTPEQRQRRVDGFKDAYAKDPSIKERKSIAAKAAYDPSVFTPEVVERRNQSIRTALRDPGYRARKSEIMKESWRRRREKEKSSSA